MPFICKSASEGRHVKGKGGRGRKNDGDTFKGRKDGKSQGGTYDSKTVRRTVRNVKGTGKV